jgi:hypothetical protein
MIEVKSSFGLELERFSKDREECILLIGSKDDIRGHAKDNNIKLTEDQIDEIMSNIHHKCDNYVMEGFWDCLYDSVDEIANEESK